MLAHILVSKFDDHLPLIASTRSFERMGADIRKHAGSLVRRSKKTVAAD